MLEIFQPIFVAEALNAANYDTAPAVLKTFPVKYWCIDHLLRSFKIAPTHNITIVESTAHPPVSQLSKYRISGKRIR